MIFGDFGDFGDSGDFGDFGEFGDFGDFDDFDDFDDFGDFGDSVKFNTRIRKQEDSNSLQNISFEKVGNLQEGYPEVCQLSNDMLMTV